MSSVTGGIWEQSVEGTVLVDLFRNTVRVLGSGTTGGGTTSGTGWREGGGSGGSVTVDLAFVILFRATTGAGGRGSAFGSLGSTTIGVLVTGGSIVEAVVFFLEGAFFFSVAADGLVDLDFFGAGVEAEREDAGEDLFFSVFRPAVIAPAPEACLVNSFVNEALIFLSIAE